VRNRPFQLLRGLNDCLAHGGAMIAVLEKLARAAPALAIPARTVQRLAARYTDARARAFDAKHDTDTFARAKMVDLGLKDPTGNDFEGWMYGPINHDFFDEIVRHVDGPENLTFLDVGSGKGLALILAERWGFRSLVGVELSPELVDVAQGNFTRYEKRTGRHVEAQMVVGDFMEQALKPEPTLFFLNNPFPHSIAQHAVTHILKSIEQHPRRAVIVYRRCEPRTQAMLDDSPLLREHRRTPYWKIWQTA
jgi:SAM-dependent methyltransferase